ncbi:MAG: ribosomal subunit interface protein [Deltaproteobacteria bacterium RBG_16_64_85]|nr:MAG: ribosomal subunit interface protein [Deltaproteobacteria bacterium RBG_16_64_85]
MSNLNVTFRHVDSSKPLKDYVIEKLGKVQKVVDKPFDAHVTLSVEKYRHIAEVFVTGKGITIKAFESTDDLYSAIDLVCDKVERQLKKYREKRKEKGQGTFPAPVVSGSSLTIQESEGARIVRSDNFLPKPMSVEEAVHHLDLLQVDVVMFVNQETNQPSVVFRQQDGNIGFTEPSAR